MISMPLLARHLIFYAGKMSHSRGGSEEEIRLLDLGQKLDSRGQQPYQDNIQVTGKPMKASVYLVGQKTRLDQGPPRSGLLAPVFSRCSTATENA